ncbi:MAG: hypothetical protein Q4A05_03515 [Ruminococcus sp.]|nr:hypothetical protein [Ruminococcus sp.]
MSKKIAMLLTSAMGLTACGYDTNSSSPTASESAVQIAQTGYSSAVPTVYFTAADEQGTVVEMIYDSKDYARDESDITKTAYVYLPYGYDENDLDTRYDICYLMHGYDDFQFEKNVDFIQNIVEENDLNERGYFIYHGVGTNDTVKSQSIDMADEMLSRDGFFTPDHYVFYQREGGQHDHNSCREFMYNALPLFFGGGTLATRTPQRQMLRLMFVSEQATALRTGKQCRAVCKLLIATAFPRSFTPMRNFPTTSDSVQKRWLTAGYTMRSASGRSSLQAIYRQKESLPICEPAADTNKERSRQGL